MKTEHDFDHCVVMKDIKGEDCMIPMSSFMNADLRLFGYCIREIRKMMRFATEKGYRS